MAILTVTTNNATGAGSLKQVLAQAADGDEIVFASNVTDITLTSDAGRHEERDDRGACGWRRGERRA